jgi:hypothetical protein
MHLMHLMAFVNLQRMVPELLHLLSFVILHLMVFVILQQMPLVALLLRLRIDSLLAF